MPKSDFAQQPAGLRGRKASHDGKTPPPDLSLVLVAGTSPVNRIVLSRIVERAGLKTIAESPEAAAELLERLRPGTVVLDGGADNRECDALLDKLAGLRRASGANLPNIILITTTSGRPERLAPGKLVDAIVAKPITPETLQPVVIRLVEQARE